MPSATVNGHSIAYEDAGQGPAVLLIHGFPLDRRMWREQVASLSSRYRLVAPDLPGFGESDPPPAEKLTMVAMADLLAGFCGELDLPRPLVVCGLSMGGYIALEFWRRHGAEVRSLILCDTRAEPDAAEAAAGRLKTADEVTKSGVVAVADLLIKKLFAPATFNEQPNVVEATRDMMCDATPAGVAAALRGMAERADFTPLLGQIDTPALLVGGQHDGITPPADMRQMAQALPRAEFLEIPAAGHMAPLEQPEKVNLEIGRFLETLRH